MAGRPATPTHLKLLKGNPGKRPLPTAEPKPKRGIPKCPAHLSDVAKTAWKKVGKDLHGMGVIAISDAIALELLVLAYAEFREANEIVRNRGFTYTSETESGGTIVRPQPEVAIAADAWRRVLRILTEFGLTPAARAKVKAIGGEISSDPVSNYL